MQPTNGSSSLHDSVGAIKILTDRRYIMNSYLYHIGIDVSNDTFDAAMFTSTSEPRRSLGNFKNDKIILWGKNCDIIISRVRTQTEAGLRNASAV